MILITKRVVLIAALIFLSAFLAFADPSICQKFPGGKVSGRGPFPYNCRLIDGHIWAGGHPLSPKKFDNSDGQVLSIMKFLKEMGVKDVVDLENSSAAQKRYGKLLAKAGLNRLHIPMSSSKVPTKDEWSKIKEKMKGPVYLHCRWGADRTGAVVARYLIEDCGYSTVEAWRAVISGGSHAGALGGLKRSPEYRNLILFISPQAAGNKVFKEYF
ncbi:MAG: hypothetical protein ABIH56_03225 [Candidatus Margulisiibacteriota bacterium]